mgnify:CR=1 FL=1
MSKRKLFIAALMMIALPLGIIGVSQAVSDNDTSIAVRPQVTLEDNIKIDDSFDAFDDSDIVAPVPTSQSDDDSIDAPDVDELNDDSNTGIDDDDSLDDDDSDDEHEDELNDSRHRR